MAGVVFVFVREDASEAETLAEAFDAAGYSITGSGAEEEALSVVVWSRAALQSRAFKHAAERALLSGRVVVASLIPPPPRENIFDAPAIDLSVWDGDDGAALDPLFEAVDEILHTAGANVIALPFRPVFEDAEFTELSLDSAEDERAERARRAWEAPIPTEMLRTVRQAPAPRKRGASAPRRDFRRVSQRKPASHVHAALAFAVIALVGGSMFAVRIAPDPTPQMRAAPTRSEPNMAVSLTSASADAAGLEDVAAMERPPLFEPAPQRGVVGVEPPSASAARRAPRRSVQRDRAEYQPPALIPDAIAADIGTGPAPIIVAEHPGGPRS
ncbi:MAG: hypothetical protein ACT4OF_06315 [Caulobacteraceae bacterium]